MTEFLAEAGKQLAGRWAALLALPAVLFVAAVTVAATLGQAHSLDVALAARSAARLAARYEDRAVPAEGAGGISRTSGELLSERLRKGC